MMREDFANKYRDCILCGKDNLEEPLEELEDHPKSFASAKEIETYIIGCYFSLNPLADLVRTYVAIKNAAVVVSILFICFGRRSQLSLKSIVIGDLPGSIKSYMKH